MVKAKSSSQGKSSSKDKSNKVKSKKKKTSDVASQTARKKVNEVSSTMKAKGKSPSSAALKKGDALIARGYLDSAETVCREVACEGLATAAGYCRLHYIKNWKKIKRKEVILREKKLNQYIEELIAKYPEKYIEAIRQDLASDKDFAKVIYDLDLDEGVDDFEIEGGDAVDSLIDTIKRDFDDDADAF